MSNNRINNLDLTDEMVEDFSAELDDDKLTDPADYEVDQSIQDSKSKTDDESSYLDSKEKKDTSIKNEDAEDDENLPEPFLSTTSGKVFVGAGLFGLTAMCLGGYIVVSNMTAKPVVAQSDPTKPTITPIYADETSVQSNNTNESNKDIPFEKTEVAKQISDKKPETQEASSGLKIVFPENKKVIASTADKVGKNSDEAINNLSENNTKEVAASTITETASNASASEEAVERFNLKLFDDNKKQIASNHTGEKSDDNTDEIKPVQKVQDVVDVTEQESVDLPLNNDTKTINIVVEQKTSEQDKIAQENPSISSEQLNEMVASIVQKQLSQKEEKISALEAEIQNLKKQQTVVTVEKEPTSEQKVENKNPVTGEDMGRERLKGFKIINTSMNGTMSIVKAPSGRTVVLYKGEKFYVEGMGSFVVNEVLNNGELLLANKNFYIDTVYEKPIAKPSKSVEKKVEPVVEKESTQKIEVKEVDNKPTEKKTYTQNIQALGDQMLISDKRAIADKWIWNGKMGEEFILQTPQGKWIMVKIGDDVDGLGMVNGLTDNNRLIIGKFLIEKAVD